tara:strand:- start:158 stop:457 length:300 start_codon:yes stop_codon:yes gene_type:complete
MKITKTELQKIIKEELNEVTVTHSDREDWTKRRPDESGRDFMRRMSYEKRMRGENLKNLQTMLYRLEDDFLPQLMNIGEEEIGEAANQLYKLLKARVEG